jgi:hypothetical protein
MENDWIRVKLGENVGYQTSEQVKRDAIIYKLVMGFDKNQILYYLDGIAGNLGKLKTKKEN